MDGIQTELDLVPGQTMPTGSGYREEEEDPEEGSADFYRREAQRAKAEAEQAKRSHQEAMRKISEQGEQLSQNNTLMQTILLASSQQQQPTTAPAAPQGNEWEQHYRKLAAEQQGGAPPAALSPDQVAQIAADQAAYQIQNTLNSINGEQALANDLWAKFQREETDLMEFRDVVKSYYQANPNMPMAERYKFAVSQTRALMSSGRLASSGRRTSATAGSMPTGGQTSAWASAPAGGKAQQQILTETDMERELTAWTKERREKQSQRKDSGFAHRVK